MPIGEYMCEGHARRPRVWVDKEEDQKEEVELKPKTGRGV